MNIHVDDCTKAKRHPFFKMISVVLLIMMTLSVRGKNLTDIYLFGLFALEGEYCGGQGMNPSAQMAIQHINLRRDVLPGYRLNLDWSNTRCDEGVSIKALSDSLNSNHTKLMIIGAECSAVSQATARASHLWNLVQLSHGSISPSLSNKALYPWFFRVIAPDSHVNAVRVKLFKAFGWKRIATISENQQLFSTTAEDLASRLNKENITVLTQENFATDPTMEVAALKKYDSRIIVGSFYSAKGRRVICEAYKIGLYGPKIVWFFPGWFDFEWFVVQNDSIDCTTEELHKVLQYSFSLDDVFYNQEDDWSITNMTSSKFRTEYTEYLNRAEKDVNVPGHERAPVAYDTIWTAALALNATNNDLLRLGVKKRIHDFTYTDSQIGKLIYENIRKTRFTGVTGLVRFDEYGDRQSMVSIRTFRDSGNLQVGVSDTTINGSIRWSIPVLKIFEEGVIPVDGVEVREEVRSVDFLVFISMCVLAALGMILALVFLFFNISCRNEKLIKMSSPKLNNVILSGCIITYISVFIQNIDNSPHIYCTVFAAKLYVMVLGFSLTFAPLLAKTWRVYAIFTAKAMLTSKVYHDWSLFLLVGGLVLTNAAILATWSRVDEPVLSLLKLKTMEGEEEDVVIQPIIYACSSTHYKYFLGSIIAIQGTLLLFGVFLALQTRKVSLSEMNDSRYIGMCMYNTMVLQGIAVTVSVSLQQEVTLRFALQSLSNILTAVVTQTLIFAPKVRAHFKQQKSRRNSQQGEENRTRHVIKTILI